MAVLQAQLGVIEVAKSFIETEVDRLNQAITFEKKKWLQVEKKEKKISSMLIEAHQKLSKTEGWIIEAEARVAMAA